VVTPQNSKIKTYRQNITDESQPKLALLLLVFLVHAVLVLTFTVISSKVPHIEL
jgi:hypothetical protein